MSFIRDSSEITTTYFSQKNKHMHCLDFYNSTCKSKRMLEDEKLGL